MKAKKEHFSGIVHCALGLILRAAPEVCLLLLLVWCTSGPQCIMQQFCLKHDLFFLKVQYSSSWPVF